MFKKNYNIGDEVVTQNGKGKTHHTLTAHGWVKNFDFAAKEPVSDDTVVFNANMTDMVVDEPADPIVDSGNPASSFSDNIFTRLLENDEIDSFVRQRWAELNPDGTTVTPQVSQSDDDVVVDDSAGDIVSKDDSDEESDDDDSADDDSMDDDSDDDDSDDNTPSTTGSPSLDRDVAHDIAGQTMDINEEPSDRKSRRIWAMTKNYDKAKGAEHNTDHRTNVATRNLVNALAADSDRTELEGIVLDTLSEDPALTMIPGHGLGN